jgi:hypothetical protein
MFHRRGPFFRWSSAVAFCPSIQDITDEWTSSTVKSMHFGEAQPFWHNAQSTSLYKIVDLQSIGTKRLKS